MKKCISSVDISLALATFCTTLFIYTTTLCPTVAGGDSGELIVAACTMGIPHPPGYPLHTMLGYLFFRFLPSGNPAARVNHLSAICSAIASSLIFLTGVILSSWMLDHDQSQSANNSSENRCAGCTDVKSVAPSFESDPSNTDDSFARASEICREGVSKEEISHPPTLYCREVSEAPPPQPGEISDDKGSTLQNWELTHKQHAARCGAFMAAGLYSFSPLVWTYSQIGRAHV